VIPVGFPAKKFFMSRVLSACLSRAVSRVLRRDGAMTHTSTPSTASAPTASTTTTPSTTPIGRLGAHLGSRSKGREARAAMARFARAGIEIADVHSPLELARWCHDHRGRSADVVGVLVRLAPGDETAMVCVLVALRPALLRTAGYLVRHGIERDDAETELVGIAWERVLAVAAAAPAHHAASAVVDGVWDRARLLVHRDRRRRDREIALGDHVDPEAIDADPGVRVTTVLADAERAKALTGRQARLVHETRVLGRPVGELATASGRDPRAVRQERRRAEIALRRHLAASFAESSPYTGWRS